MKIKVDLSLLERLLPLVIVGNNAAIEGMCDTPSDTDAELELEHIITHARPTL